MDRRQDHGPVAATAVTRDGQDAKTAATSGVATPRQPAAAPPHRNRGRSVCPPKWPAVSFLFDYLNGTA